MGWPYQQKPPLGWPLDYDSGLVPETGYWPENEGSGNKVFDLSGNGETGTIGATGVWTAGKFGPALIFDGANTAISLSTGISYKTQTPGDDFSYSVWVNVSGFPEGNNGMIICTFNDSVSYFRWRRAGDGEYFEVQVDYVTSDARTKTSNLGDAAVTDVWTHVVVVHHDATKTTDIYINGIEETSYITQTAGVGARVDRSNLVTFIGNNNGMANSFNGLIDIPMIYNRALSAGEIALLYQYPFWMFKDPAEMILASAGQVAVGANPKGPLGHPLYGALAGPISF